MISYLYTWHNKATKLMRIYAQLPKNDSLAKIGISVADTHFWSIIDI